MINELDDNGQGMGRLTYSNNTVEAIIEVTVLVFTQLATPILIVQPESPEFISNPADLPPIGLNGQLNTSSAMRSISGDETLLTQCADDGADQFVLTQFISQSECLRHKSSVDDTSRRHFSTVFSVFVCSCFS